MRQRAQLAHLFVLVLLISGCQGFDPTRFWKLNRGEDYMNSDQYFSVPAQMPTPPSAEHNRPE